MTKKPALCYAVARGAHFSGKFVVFRVTSERERQFSGVETGNINSTTRSIRDLIAKFPDEETAIDALAAYRERWRAHSDLVADAEKRLRIERTNRVTSAMDALKAFQSTPHVPTVPLIVPMPGPAEDAPYVDLDGGERGDIVVDHGYNPFLRRGIRSAADDNGE